MRVLLACGVSNQVAMLPNHMGTHIVTTYRLLLYAIGNDDLDLWFAEVMMSVQFADQGASQKFECDRGGNRVSRQS